MAIDPLTAMAFFQGVSSLTGSFGQSRAQRAQGEFNQRIADMNAKLADYQAEDAMRRGEQAVTQHRKKTSQMIGSQRAAMAAQGIDIESGSAMEIQESTRLVSEEDVSTIKINAYRQAWGFKAQALDFTAKGEIGRMVSEQAAQSTLLTGITQAGAYGLQGAYYHSKNAAGGSKVPETKKHEAAPGIAPDLYIGKTPFWGT